MLEQVVANETSKYVAGIIGSILSLHYAAESASRIEKLFMSATGISVAIFCAPAVQHYLKLSDEYTLGLAFVLGMYGWSVTGGVFKIIKSKELQEIIMQRIKRFFK